MIAISQRGEINNRNAKKVFEKIFDEDIDPILYIEEQGMKSVKDTKMLEEVAAKIVAENEKAAQEYRSGKEKAFGFFVGQVMRQMKGNADPESVREVLKKILE